MLYESSIIQLITIQPITIQHEYPKFSDVLRNTVQLPLLKPNITCLNVAGWIHLSKCEVLWEEPINSYYINCLFLDRFKSWIRMQLDYFWKSRVLNTPISRENLDWKSWSVSEPLKPNEYSVSYIFNYIYDYLSVQSFYNTFYYILSSLFYVKYWLPIHQVFKTLHSIKIFKTSTILKTYRNIKIQNWSELSTVFGIESYSYWFKLRQYCKASNWFELHRNWDSTVYR